METNEVKVYIHCKLFETKRFEAFGEICKKIKASKNWPQSSESYKVPPELVPWVPIFV